MRCQNQIRNIITRQRRVSLRVPAAFIRTYTASPLRKQKESPTTPIMETIKVNRTHDPSISLNSNLSPEHNWRELRRRRPKIKHPSIYSRPSPRPLRKSSHRNRRQRRNRLRLHLHSPATQHLQSLHPLCLRRSSRQRQLRNCQRPRTSRGRQNALDPM